MCGNNFHIACGLGSQFKVIMIQRLIQSGFISRSQRVPRKHSDSCKKTCDYIKIYSSDVFSRVLSSYVFCVYFYA